ncbi:MAG: VanW family protein [Bacteroides sp.]|nr:VanW family protein [Bacillota bacterium]MCM1394232.1 VanW family protein [[Eubacterium] siraeum]MCM1455997.1 VanW family protein [Bacteroides sp.]
MRHKGVAKSTILIMSALAVFFAALGGGNMKAEATSDAPKLIAHFSTYYGESSENRKFNVELAARKISGTTLYPEDEFSFNDCVGRRTEANGFKSAFIIQDGEFIEGVGGGVCQVSSTLYNCALLAGLSISQVAAHSLPVSYVAPSFDAMVSSETDFRFVNTLSGKVTLKVLTDGKYIRAEIYGCDSASIRRRSETVETIPHETEYRDDDTLPLGEEVIDTYGKNGIKSEGYLDYFENGKLIKSVRIRKDFYKPQKRIILKGTKI